MASPHLSKFGFITVGRKIICVGRNYSEHAKELGNAIPEKPLLFMKPPSAYITEGSPIKFPMGCKSLHHEIELGIVISSRCSQVDKANVMDHVGGYVLALDMTARDFQDEAKKKGSPWTLAKAFDTSCPVSSLIPKEKIPDPHNLELWCNVNGIPKQRGNTKDMIFDIPTLLSYISNYFTLEAGDVILTGTPAGVGPVQKGDTIQGGITDVITMNFSVDS